MTLPRIVTISAARRPLERYSFGGGPELADKLAELVLAGVKCATCWSAADGKRTEVGRRMVLMDGSGRPRAVTETIELSLCRFVDVDAAFAYDEGEGDRTLTFWREAHLRYFTRVGQFEGDMWLWCERFRVVDVLDP